MSEDFYEVGDTKILKTGREFTVYVPMKEGKVTVVFSEISQSRQSFSAVMSVQLDHSTEGLQTPFSQRIDLNSASAITDLRRSLDGAFGKQHNWTIVLNKAANALRQVFVASQKPSFFLEDPYAEDTFLLRPFLQKDACNMVFGDSEVGKTYFCLRLAISLALGMPFLGYAIPEKGRRTLILDYEDTPASFNNRLIELCGGLGVNKREAAASIGWYKPAGSIRDIVEIVSKFVTDNKFDLIIIDAGSNAAGGSPNDEQRVIDMFNALEQIPCTKLIIHHEPKDSEGKADNKAYYGSTFWRALNRVAWRLVLENEDDGKLIKAVVAKKSNMGKVDPIMYRQKWLMNGFDYLNPNIPVTCTISVTDVIPKKSLETRIMETLQEHGPLTGSQIKDMTGLTADQFKKVTQKMKDDKVLKCEGTTRNTVWKLRS